MRVMPARAVLATVVVTLLIQPTMSAAGSEPDLADSYGSVRSILPPGQSGTIDAADLVTVLAGDPVGRIAVDGKNAPENFADQLEMYDALTRKPPAELTTSDVTSLFKDAGFTPATVVRQETPRAGVKIQWDEFGVPYVNGDSFDNVAFGAGYAGTLDRMFLMDVLRHAGRAELAAFAGATPANLAQDQTQLRSAFYTEQEATAQFDKLVERFGDEGRRLVQAADHFLAGINAAQNKLCPLGLPTGPRCPAEYLALQKTPARWTRADIVYLASMVGGIFGKGGGGEYDNAVWAQRLIARFGKEKGLAIYRDLRHKNDPDAPTTTPNPAPYGGGDQLRPNLAGVALPDVDGPTAPGTGSLIGQAAQPLPAPLDDSVPSIELPTGSIKLPLKQGGMSNALVVGAKHSATGKPIAVFGPQTGYFAPQLWTEQVLVGPGIKSRGVAFAGTHLVNQIGRGVDYAWSATSSGSDNVDTVVERLCNTDGSAATIESTGYLVGSTCRPLERFEHSYTALPGPTSPTPPKTYRYLVLRSKHGIVQSRTTVDGRPVAIVLERSTYGHEVDSVVGFARWNMPDVVKDVQSFQRAGDGLDFTFNWFYADDKDIGFFSSGLLPRRSSEVDLDLPRWGEARFDWNGWLSWERHPRDVNPGQGYFVNWNNKPAPGFAAADNNWGHGSTHRSLALEDRVQAAIGGGDVDVPEAVGVMSGAATQDSRALYTLPLLLDVLGDDPDTEAARALLQAWADDDAPRVDRDRDGHYEHEAAIALFDTWWEKDGKGVAHAVMEGQLGDLARQLPAPLDDHPRGGIGSAWNNVAWYGYLNKDLGQLLGQDMQRPYAFGYCGAGDLGSCRSALRASLSAAEAAVLAEQGAGSVGELTYDKGQDSLRSTAAGVVGVRPMDWQNRPTFQQVVAFTGHRPR